MTISILIPNSNLLFKVLELNIHVLQLYAYNATILLSLNSKTFRVICDNSKPVTYNGNATEDFERLKQIHNTLLL